MKRKIFSILSIVFALALALGFVLVPAVPAGAIPLPTTRNVPGEYPTIQAAITAANPGDTINVAPGTYPEALDLKSKTLTIEGAGIELTIVDAHLLTGHAIQNFGNSSTIRNLKLIGTSNSYGFKVSGVSGITLQNIRVENSGKTGVDLNTVNGATLDGITVVNTVAGFGVMILDSNNVTVTNVSTSGNAWGGVSVQTKNRVSGNVNFMGIFDAQEGVPLLLEQDPDPEDGTYYDITNITIPSQFTHIVYALRVKAAPDPENYKQTFYRLGQQEAKTFAQSLIAAPPPYTYSDMTICDIAEENYYVIEGMKIQDAVDAASGTTIHVDAGTYAGAIVNKDVTISGAEGGASIITSGVQYKVGGPAYTTAFRLDGGADGTVINNFTINNNQGAKFYFAVFARGADNVTIDSLAVNDTVQGITNWGGSGWVITHNTITGTVAAGGGGIGILLGARLPDYRTCSNNLVQYNIINATATAADFSCPGILLCLDVRYGGYDLLNGTEDVSGNQILNNEITSSGVNNSVGIEVGTILDTEDVDDPVKIAAIMAAAAVHDNTVQENTVDGADMGIYFYNVTDLAVTQNEIENSVGDGIYAEHGQSGTVIQNNDFSNNAIQLTDNTNDTETLDTLDIGGILNNNTFDRAVTVDHSGASLLHTIWSKIQDGVNNAVASDNVNVAAGTYDESVTINKNNLTLIGQAASRPAITGGLKFDTITGLALQNFYVTGTAVLADNSIVRMNGVITNLTVDNCVFDGEDIADRMGFTGGQIEGDLTVTSSEFKNILGWAVFDTRSGSGGDGSAMGTVTFARNNVHDCNGSVVFRGLSTDRTDLVNAYDNTWNNIGDNGGDQGEQWAALEVNRAITVNVYDNTVNDVAQGEWGEGQAFQFWDIDTLKVHGNDITSNYQGIWIYGGGTFAVPGGYISFNNIIGNNQYGISVDPTTTGGTDNLNAINNWWGTKSGPTHAANRDGTGDKVSDKVNYTPWTGAEVKDSKTETVSDNVDATDEADTLVIKSGTGTPTITVAEYTDNPGTGSFSGDTGKYIDVNVDNTTGVDEIEIRLYYKDAEIAGVVESSLRLQWWDSDNAIWVGIIPYTASGVNTTDIPTPPPAGAPYSGYMWAKITDNTTPNLTDLIGSVFGGGGSAAAGGGGGGGGGGLTLPTVKGLVSTPPIKLDPEGKIQARCVVQTDDGKLTLDIAKGTRLLDTLRRALTSLSAALEPSPPAPPSGAAIILAYDFGPNGAVFMPAITMTIEYDPATFSEDIAEEGLYIAYWDGSKWVALTTTVDTMTRTASCKVSHLTTFALIGAVTPPAPAAFSVSGLSIYPLKVEPEEAVAITVAVANTGGTEGSYNVALKINGVQEAEESVTVAPGSSQSVSFSVAREEAGSYSVDVNGLSGSFTVAAGEGAPPEGAKPPISWTLIWIIIAVAVVVGLIIFLAVRRRAY